MKALTNARVYTMEQGVLAGGTVLIEDGKIVAVGQNVSVPAEAEVVDAADRVIMPGIIDAHTHIGIGEEGLGWEGQDYNEVSDPVTPHLRAIDGINPRDEGFADARRGGVTTVMTGPGSANILGGQNTVLKTRGRTVEEMILRDPAGVKGALGENPKRVYGRGQNKSPVTRMASAALLRKALSDAQEYQRKLERGEEDPDKKPDRDLKQEVMVRVLRKELPLRLHAHRADDIMTILRVAREFDIDVTLEHCTEGHLIAEEIAAAGVPAVVGPSLTSRSKVELQERTFKTPGILNRAGVKVALMSDHPVIPLQYLPLVAALAAREGMAPMEALKAITIYPAEVLGVADRVGSLAEGKDADLIVLSGEPLEVMSEVEAVYIDGEEVFARKAEQEN